jgi:hypothetical protein
MGTMNTNDQIEKLEREIANFNRIIAWLTSSEYQKHYRKQQWRAWIMYLFTRNLPKNKEWMFTTQRVEFPIICLPRGNSEKFPIKKVNYWLLAMQMHVYKWWANCLPLKVSHDRGRMSVPFPYLIREDTEEHITLLHMFRDEKVTLLDRIREKLGVDQSAQTKINRLNVCMM